MTLQHGATSGMTSDNKERFGYGLPSLLLHYRDARCRSSRSICLNNTDYRVQTVRIDTEYTCMNIKYRYVNDSFLYAFSKVCSLLIDSVLDANG